MYGGAGFPTVLRDVGLLKKSDPAIIHGLILLFRYLIYLFIHFLPEALPECCLWLDVLPRAVNITEQTKYLDFLLHLFFEPNSPKLTTSPWLLLTLVEVSWLATCV